MRIISENNHLKVLDILSNSNINEWHKVLKETKSYSANDIKEYQELKLNNVIRHANKNSIFYKYQFQNSQLDLKNSFTIEQLKKLPILRREDIRKNYNKIVSNNFESFKPLHRTTGGTTGTPLKYLYDKDSWSLGWALKIRDWNYGNYKIGDKMALLAGSSVIPNQKKNYKRDIWNSLNGFSPLSTVHFDENVLKNYYNIIKRGNVSFLRGYPSSLLGFAEYMNKSGLKLPIKAIFTTAEVLQLEHREYIEDVFDCKIFDQYGAADACAHASECDHHNGFHISFEPSICEIVNIEENFDGKKIGELVYTSLTNYSMPMIRYAPGDMAELQESLCSCGRKTLMVKKIIGRTTERILFANGRVLAGPAFTLIFRKFDLKNYQLVQNTKDSIDINLVKGEKYSLSQESEMLNIMKFHCGNDVNIKINYLSEIKKVRSSKHRFIVSNL